MAQQVEHVLGKDGVTGSNPVSSSKKALLTMGSVFCFSRFCFTQLQFLALLLYSLRSWRSLIPRSAKGSASRGSPVTGLATQQSLFRLFVPYTSD